MGKFIWRDTAMWPRLLGIDARSLVPMAIFLLHFSWNTFYIGVAGVAFFTGLELVGYTPMAAWRFLLRKISGRTRTGRDFGVLLRRVQRSRYTSY